MKKKIFKAAVCAGLGVCLTLTAAGCKKSSKLDPETRPLMLATAALDGNFNPFTYTSQTDGDILSLTQLGMFTNDNDGSLICGQNEATVALNYSVTMYDSKKEGTGSVTSTGSKDGRTEYEIVIKNGIKFSDNVPLTIKDVLFNLYVYLDVAYTGSSTIYSTDIQGLAAYRAQDITYSDDDKDNDISATFTAAARQRVVNILQWIEDSDPTETVPADAQIKADYDLTLNEFRKELNDDWTALETSWKTSYEENYNFTAAWQAYLFQEGIAEVQTRLNTITNGYEQIKNSQDKYVTTLEPTVDGCNNGAPEVGEVKLQHYIDGIAAATTPALVSARAQQDNCSEETALLTLQKEYCINEVVFKTYTEKSELSNVLQYWATASNVIEKLTAQERTKYYEGKTDGVDNVSGITTSKVTGDQLKARNNWEMKGETFNDTETYDVLKIVINGIDPKAIFNFAFTVTPLHYYSGTWNNKDYVDAAMKDTQNKEFGVQVGNSDFFTEVISGTDKNGVPVGAGAYMASTRNGGKATKGGEFKDDNIVYFERNPYFETVGTGINNAVIKYVRYRVTADDLIMSGLKTQTIDYGTPTAKSENLNQATTEKHLEAERYQAGGYGYVGINPKFVPELEIRQAIMKAMNTRSIIQDYYRGGLAVNIWRPMTKTSWAYPESATEYSATAYTTNDDDILNLVKTAGYEKGSDGIFAKNNKKLKLTFTIAGDTKDHPARAMFEDAANTLNQLGFNITVSTSSQALKEMTRGNLAVWAAAWSSSIDPDPYQVYHKDSKATSVNNWNYAEILNENNHQFDRERIIVNDLSDLIDAGRAVLKREDRIPVYAQCLDKIMELAVELPTYQRNELCIYNSKVLDRSSMVTTPTAYNGLLSRMWELNYVK